MMESAVAAALAVAQEHGLRCDDAVVLRDAWHVLVHLRPSPVVARVSSSIPFPEGPSPDDIARELDVATHCARAGCAVVPPADDVDPGPHHAAGHVVTFWRYVEPFEDPDEDAAVRALREIHDALESYSGALPEFGHPEDVAAMLDALEPSGDVELLREITARRPEVVGQALHGDAHLFNVLGTPGGPLWHDFETACRGPREYDLAALAENASLEAFGSYDRDLFKAMWPHYAAWVTTSMLTALPRRPDLAAPVERRLRQLRDS
jgi:phosphotransferase family enzyme